jgi:hypothetical protein
VEQDEKPVQECMNFYIHSGTANQLYKDGKAGEIVGPIWKIFSKLLPYHIQISSRFIKNVGVKSPLNVI